MVSGEELCKFSLTHWVLASAMSVVLYGLKSADNIIKLCLISCR